MFLFSYISALVGPCEVDYVSEGEGYRVSTVGWRPLSGVGCPLRHLICQHPVFFDFGRGAILGVVVVTIVRCVPIIVERAIDLALPWYERFDYADVWFTVFCCCVAFINGWQGSARGTAYIDAGHLRNTAAYRRRIRYLIRLPQRSARTQSSREEPPPLSGYRPRTPKKRVWGRGLLRGSGASSSDEWSEASSEHSEHTGAIEPLVVLDEAPSVAGMSCREEDALGLVEKQDERPMRVGKLYSVSLFPLAMLSGRGGFVTPLDGGGVGADAWSLGFRSYELVEYDESHFESACRKMAGMQVTSPHSIATIRFQCAQLGFDVRVLPRLVLQHLMFQRVSDNRAGAGEVGIHISDLNVLAPGWIAGACSYNTLLSLSMTSHTSLTGCLRHSMMRLAERCERATSGPDVPGKCARPFLLIGRYLAQASAMGASSIVCLTTLYLAVRTASFMTRLALVFFISASYKSYRRLGRLGGHYMLRLWLQACWRLSGFPRLSYPTRV